MLLSTTSHKWPSFQKSLRCCIKPFWWQANLLWRSFMTTPNLSRSQEVCKDIYKDFGPSKSRKFTVWAEKMSTARLARSDSNSQEDVSKTPATHCGDMTWRHGVWDQWDMMKTIEKSDLANQLAKGYSERVGKVKALPNSCSIHYSKPFKHWISTPNFPKHASFYY